jgi:predicted transcriptional regulator
MMLGSLTAPSGLLAGLPLSDVIAEITSSPGGTSPAPSPTPPVGGEALPVLPESVAIASFVLTAVIAAGTRHVTRDNVLEHQTRQEMFEYTWETGAAHLRQIANALDLSTTNATWHLDKLVDAGLLGQVKVNGYRMYYPKGQGRLLREQCLVAGQLQSDNARRIIDYVSNSPGSHQREIARALDVNHGTARWHLSRLEEADLLESREEGRVTAYRLSERASRVLRDLPPVQLQEEVSLA